jgi:general secretion pathway protein G
MNRGKGRRGFTLIEILVVIVILTILVGIVVGAAKYAITKGQTSRAQAEIATMEDALERYKSDNGAYPSSDIGSTTRALAVNNAVNDSISLYVALTTPKSYMTFKPNQLKTVGGVTYIVDPFGLPYNYYCHPSAGDQKNPVTFDLWSYGPDNTSDTGDDLTNWK